MRDIAVFGGSAHPDLAAEICLYLAEPKRPVRITRFANDCLEVQLQSNCRERDVFIIQPLVPPVQENLVELLLMADAARGASASRVTAVMPHYAYARSDKKDEPRISIGGRLVADLLVTAGVNRVLTLTLHSPQVHGFFSVPVDHLHALRELAGHFRGRPLDNTVVVSPDLGNAKSAAAFARRLGVPVAAGAKERYNDSRVSISAIIGDVAGRDVIVLDDEIARGTTVFELLDRLREQKVNSISVACTHGLFADGALDRLAAQDDVSEIVCSNSVPVPAGNEKLHVLSVAPALAEAIRRIHNGESVSSLFNQLPAAGCRIGAGAFVAGVSGRSRRRPRTEEMIGMQYLVSVIYDAADLATPEEMAAIDVFNDRIIAEGHWVFAGGLGAPGSATVIDNRGEAAMITDGPFLESKEFLAGFWIMEAADLDVALRLAAEGSKACNRKVEVRPFL